MADVRVDACRSKALTVLVLVFVGGAASGVIGSHVFQSVVTTTPVVTTRGDLPAPHSDALHRLSQELLLDAAQVQQVREILDQCIMHEADLMLQLRANQSSSRDRILEMLKPEQRSKFRAELLEASSERETSF